MQAAYCGAKHAIVGFTESVRTELLHRGSAVQLCMVHLPGVNTPQFDWVLHRGLAHHPVPVPPVYQPEVAAKAIVHVAEHPRRQTFVGLPTVLTMLANRLAPSLVDRYLARTNVAAQQSAAHDPPAKQANTWRPVGGSDVAAHGVVDDVAHARSPQHWLVRHRRRAAGAMAAAGLAMVAWKRRR